MNLKEDQYGVRVGLPKPPNYQDVLDAKDNPEILRIYRKRGWDWWGAYILSVRRGAPLPLTIKDAREERDAFIWAIDGILNGNASIVEALIKAAQNPRVVKA